jgi:heme-degrading monooxygenase HmoA
MTQHDMPNSDAFVHVALLSIETTFADQVVEHVRIRVAEALSHMRGFLSLTVLVATDKSRVAVLSEWERSRDWAQAEWDTGIQDLVATLYGLVLNMDSHSYERVFRLGESSSTA